MPAYSIAPVRQGQINCDQRKISNDENTPLLASQQYPKISRDTVSSHQQSSESYDLLINGCENTLNTDGQIDLSDQKNSSKVTNGDENDLRKLLENIGLTLQARRSSLAALGIFWFFTGVEYAVILPTIWEFLQQLGASKRWYLGLTISLFSIASMISSPIFGSFADTGGTKRLIIFASVMMIVGNFIYMIANDPYCILEARFICGIGSGAAASSFAYLARVSTRAERTATIGTIIACRQIGVLIGPALNFGLANLRLNIGPFVIDSLTSPGAVMCVLWAVCLIIMVICFADIKSSETHYDFPKKNECAPVQISNTIQHNPVSYVEQAIRDESKDSRDLLVSDILGVGKWHKASIHGEHPAVQIYNQRARSKTLPSRKTSSLKSPQHEFHGKEHDVSQYNFYYLKSFSDLNINEDFDNNCDSVTAYVSNSCILSQNEDISIDEQNTMTQRDVTTVGDICPVDCDAPIIPNKLSTHSSSSTGYRSFRNSAQGMRGDFIANLSVEQKRLSKSNISNTDSTFGIKSNQPSLDQHGHGSEVLSESAEEVLENCSVSECSKGAESKYMTRWEEYTQLHIIVLFLVQFLCIFNQVGLETWVTPFTQQFFDWHERQNSIMYIGIGALALGSFAIVRVLTVRGMGDRWLMAVGISCEVVGLVLAMILFSFATPHSSIALIAFIVSCSFIVFGLPFLFIPAPAILSKLTHDKHQGFGQGLRRTIVSSATIVGPLWAGAVSKDIHTFIGLMIGLSVIASLSFCGVFSRLQIV